MSFKIGLALGGGGVRGFAHLGILRVLKSEGIPVSLITGTSFGSIVGATYCIDANIDNCQNRLLSAVSERSVKELELLVEATAVEDKQLIIEKFADFVKDLCLWNLKVMRPWLVDPQPLEEVIDKLLGSYKFSDLKLPFACLSADLLTGERVELRSGEIVPAVMASISLAGVFPPRKSGDKLLIDGGALSIVPIDLARNMGADFVIGVNVEGSLLFNDIRNGLDALFQAYEITSYELNRIKLKSCDFVIEPDLQDIKWSQFSKSLYSIKAGEAAAVKVIDDLKKEVNKAGRRKKVVSVLKLRNKRKKKE